MKLLGKAISGTCGARTYSVGGAGVTARQKVCPVNKNSIAQARRRGIFAAAGSAFKALTALQRAELHARALAASETDVFGKKITLSDYAFFLREWMHGIRPEPQTDASIELMTMLRGTQWDTIFATGMHAQCKKEGKIMTDEMRALIKQCGTNFTVKDNTGNSFRSLEAISNSNLNFITRYEATLSNPIKQLKFTDSLGRVFYFKDES